MNWSRRRRVGASSTASYGYEVSPVLWRKVGRGTVGRTRAERRDATRRRARARAHGVPRRVVLGHRGTSTRTDQSFPATLVALDGTSGSREGRDFDADTGTLAADANVALLDGAARSGSRSASRDAPFTVRRWSEKPFTEKPKAPFTTSTLQQEASRKLRLQRGGRTMSRRPAPLRARLHHLHAYRQHQRCRSRRSPRPAGRSRAVRRRVPPRRAARLPQQGEERAGGARGDPPRRRPHPHPPGRPASCARRVRALRADLEAHRRLADGRRPRPSASR
jgi:hypothetical protein